MFFCLHDIAMIFSFLRGCGYANRQVNLSSSVTQDKKLLAYNSGTGNEKPGRNVSAGRHCLSEIFLF